jgi:hypothetical protein
MSSPDHAAYTFADAKAEFDRAWADPNCTRFELPAVDVNQVLQDRYEVAAPVHVTRSMVWDMEAKKAWDPATYIPYVVSEGMSWGRHRLADGHERFFRASDQAAWIGSDRGRILEDVFVNHADQEVYFLGRGEMVTEAGDRIRAGDHQPLFHVVHAAGGPESAPLNLWRIVMLTEREDSRLIQPFVAMAAAGLLPGFLEIYIARDLGVDLRRR